MIRHPIRWPRAILAALGVYAAIIGVGLTLELLVLDPQGFPEWAQFLIGTGLAAIGLWVVLPRLRWWYRPVPRETEGRL